MATVYINDFAYTFTITHNRFKIILNLNSLMSRRSLLWFRVKFFLCCDHVGHHTSEDRGVPYHWLLDNSINRLTSKETSKLCVTSLCDENPPVTGITKSMLLQKSSPEIIWLLLWQKQVYGACISNDNPTGNCGNVICQMPTLKRALPSHRERFHNVMDYR